MTCIGCKVCWYGMYNDVRDYSHNIRKNCFTVDTWFKILLGIDIPILAVGITMTIFGVVIGGEYMVGLYIGLGLLLLGLIPWVIIGILEGIHKCKQTYRRYEKRYIEYTQINDNNSGYNNSLDNIDIVIDIKDPLINNNELTYNLDDYDSVESL